MNKVVLMGRMTRDPEVRYTQNDNPIAIARYTLAVDRRFSRSRDNNDGQQTADFISCVAFGKGGEFVEKYCHKGTKLVVSGRIQTGSYTNRDGQKIYTTEVVAEEQEFAESKNNSGGEAPATSYGSSGGYSSGNNQGAGYSYQNQQQSGGVMDGFMNIPEDIDEELPFQ